MPGEKRRMKILRHGSIVAVALLATAIGFMSCSRGGKLTSIRVAPANPTIATGTKQLFIAMAIFSNGTEINWTSAATWSTSDATAVTMGNTLGTFGLATSLATGTFIITATDEVNNISGTAMLTVVDPISITIAPNAPFMAKNTLHQFTATATLADIASGSTTTITQNLTSSPTLSWSVSDNTIATISSTGLVTTGPTSGTTTIMALYSSSTPTAVTTLTVTDKPLASIAITPNPAGPITVGSPPLQFTAQGTFEDGSMTPPGLTSSWVWSSSATGVATISNTPGSNGLATAVAPGPTTITATDPITSISSPGIRLTVN